VPRFSPEHFALVRLEDPLRRKHLDKGLRHLAEEGTILLLFSESLSGPVPIVGAVGRLQFDVLVDRLRREYGVEISLETLPFHCASWVTGPDAEVRRVASGYGRRGVRDAEGHALILFDSQWVLERAASEEKDLRFHDVQPGAAGAQAASPQAAQVGASGSTRRRPNGSSPPHSTQTP